MYVCTSFFFKDTPTTEIYTLSLHDALPIFDHVTRETGATTDNTYDALNRLQSVTHKNAIDAVMASYAYTRDSRSEEHTSELQSHSDLVCRLLLEKKKKQNKKTRTTTIET